MSDMTLAILISVLGLAVCYLYARLQDEKDQTVAAREAARRLATLAKLQRKQLESAYEKIVKNTPDDELADELNRKLRQENGDL